MLIEKNKSQNNINQYIIMKAYAIEANIYKINIKTVIN